jgi:hypothetical protein
VTDAYLKAWLAAFLFTQIVEMPIYSLGLRVGPLRAFGASAITHPLLWFGFFPYVSLPYLWKLALGEVAVFLIEAGYFAFLFRRKRALLWSALANGASLGLGMLSRHLFGMP